MAAVASPLATKPGAHHVAARGSPSHNGIGSLRPSHPDSLGDEEDVVRAGVVNSVN
jgi:hypothetical protein